jgi:hypothetical protein
MIDYSESIIDIRKALLKFEDYANKRQWYDAKTEILKIRSSALILNKILEKHVPK